jgi:hypothetical protein
MATWQHGNMATWQHGNMATWQQQTMSVPKTVIVLVLVLEGI